MEVAIIAPFSNLTIITTNSIPKEKERGDALIVRMIIWRPRQQRETSLLSSKSATTGRAFSERFLYTAGGRRDEAPACHHCQFCAKRSSINDDRSELDEKFPNFADK